jgi:serine/threonine protein kinase/tetratricopeptide (TPR) repeat protein
VSQKLGEYEILDQLGEGGMGAVFRARHERLGRMVALKVLRPGSVSNPEHERRFQREMTIAATLSHPALVKILDGGTADETGFIAMELVEGLTITNIVNRWAPLPWPVALAISSRIADGLAYLHEKTILHRDIKPSNILLSQEGWVKLLDFGLARWAGSTVMTQEGAVVGTLQFLSPELLTGEDASPMSDLWATGCVMYLMLAGRMHVMATEFSDWLQAIVNDPIPPPGHWESSIPAPVSQLVARLLSRDPAQRPQSAAMLRDAIDGLLESLAGTTWDRVLGPDTLQQIDRGTYAIPGTSQQNTAFTEVPPTPQRPVSRPSSRAGMRSRTGAPSTRPGSQGSAPSTPSAPTHIRPRALALAVPLFLVTGLVLMLVSRPSPPPAPPSPTESASASSAPPRGRKPLSAHGRDFAAYLPRLRAGGQTAKRAVEDVKAASPLDFGHTAANWVFWIELDQWLANPNRPKDPPRYEFRTEGPLNAFDESISLSWISRHASGLSESLVTTAFRSTGGAPDDGRPWLLLGRALELEGRAAESVVAYGLALDRLTFRPWGDFPPFLWTALARALLRAPGHDLDREWWTFLPKTQCRKAWIGLAEALKGEPRERLDRILKVGLEHAHHRDMVNVVLGTVLVESGGDPERARKVWSAALREVPNAAEVLNALLHHYCSRGRVAEARALAANHKVAHFPPIVAYLGGDMEADLGWKSQKDPYVRIRLLQLETFRHMEKRRLAEAEEMAETLQAEDRAPVREQVPLYLELIGQRSRMPWLEKTAGKLLQVDPPDHALWMLAAGSLATDRGEAFMRKCLAPPPGVVNPDAMWREAIAAVWCSRRREHAQALDHLARADAFSRGDELPGFEAAEVLTRPALDALLGRPVDRAVLERAKSMRRPARQGSLSPYVEHVLNGELDRAREILPGIFELNPEHAYFGVAWAWVARLTGRAAEERDARARVAASVRWHATGLWALRALGEERP